MSEIEDLMLFSCGEVLQCENLKEQVKGSGVTFMTVMIDATDGQPYFEITEARQEMAEKLRHESASCVILFLESYYASSSVRQAYRTILCVV